MGVPVFAVRLSLLTKLDNGLDEREKGPRGKRGS